MTDLTNQVAVVTGASGGIGRAVALGLANDGATVFLVGRDGAALASVAERARAAGARAVILEGDLTSDDTISELAARLQRECGRADILVHCAGIISQGAVESAPVEDFDRQFRINARAPYLLTQVLLPMLKETQGQVVFVNSTVGLNARANVGQYAATKHALRALADSLRDEVNAEGLRVLSVFLGRTDSPMQAAIQEVEGRAYTPGKLVQPDDVAAAILCALRMPRSAEVAEITIRPMRKLGD